MDPAVLRIYMPVTAKRKGRLTLWQKMFSSALSGFLLKEAKAFGIEQAIYQRVFGGYLKGQKLVFDLGEYTPPEFPQVVELLDQETKIRAFVEKYRDQLSDCRAVILKTSELIS
jgi:PII-like signaling protein